MSRLSRDVLDLLRASGVLSPVDVHLARSLCRLGGSEAEAVALGVALASQSIEAGHVCADLAQVAGRPVVDLAGEPVGAMRYPALPDWRQALMASRLIELDDDGAAPLVLDGADRLYLARYYRYERQLAAALSRRAEAGDAAVDLDLLRQGLDRLFPGDAGELGSQKAAAAIAVLRRLAVIAGGPGTGKTTTIVKVLALLQEQARAQRRVPLRIALLAPTGKAAARLGEAVAAGALVLDCAPDIAGAVSAEASTIHRKLGYQPGRATRFKHDRDDPLRTDVVVVDEASMVDLALMAKLVEAVPEEARLVLLGDPDQLASVEAGAILGDLCRAGKPRRAYSRAHASRLAQLGIAIGAEVSPAANEGVADCIAHLTKSWRFGATSAIGALASAVKAGDGDAVIEVLSSPTYAEAVLLEPGERTRPAELLQALLLRGFGPYLQTEDPLSALDALDRFRVLCAHRRGRFGVERVNVDVERTLAAAGLLAPADPWYAHRPIIVTSNDYQLQLFNGDVGVALPVEPGRDELRVWFRSAEPGQVRGFAPTRLPPHETVFAMTVHKSQGSELDEIALVLPKEVSRVLTRELFYTGVTRARQKVTVVADREVIGQAVARRIRRASGLQDALWA